MDSPSEAAFDQSVDIWKEEQQQPWMALRYHLEHAHINRHVTGRRLHILDAGGGNGGSAIRLAREGHAVTIVDFSAEMLADGKAAATASGVLERVSFYRADVARIPKLFPEPVFDLVLCHNVLQYVEDVPATLRALVHPLRPRGWLSVVVPNRFAEVYKAAIRELDPERARRLLDREMTRATLFGVAMRAFMPDELDEPLSTVNCPPVARYGVRCLCDWLPNEPKSDPVFMERLERLEMEVADKYPYYLLARFLQTLARKNDVGNEKAPGREAPQAERQIGS